MDDRESKRDFIDLIRKVVELAQPDLRPFYRMTRKARIVDVYASDGQYFADVQPLRNDESVDNAEPACGVWRCLCFGVALIAASFVLRTRVHCAI